MASGWYILILCLACLLWGGASAQEVDLTMKAGAKGAPVVRAVIEKISITPLFRDECEWWNISLELRVKFKTFLRTAAFVLTEDGESKTNGGIWNASVFNSTKCNLYNYQDRLEKVNTTVTTLSTSLSKPMYSGLAAALCLHQYLTLQSQCSRVTFPSIRFNYELWMNAIGTNLSSEQWEDKEDTLQDQEQCSVQSDVVFVMDSSISVILADFNEIKEFARNITKKLNTSDTRVSNRVGVITYGRIARTPLPLTTITNKNILMTIDSIRHYEELTNTADGLCELAKQSWRNNSAVFRLAIVLTDGMSNRNATNKNCSGNVTKVASMIRMDFPHILVIAIGIGNINYAELSDIASRNGLTSALKQYTSLRSMSDVLRYQICHTLSADVTVNDSQAGTVRQNEIMRWVLNNVTQFGVSIRFCISSGGITFYVAQEVPASTAIHEKKSTITKTDTRLDIVCETFFERTYNNRRIQKRQASQSSVIYLSIEGQGSINTFTLQSSHGNVSLDINECESNPSPCDKSATCHNTDGSFYCECNLGYDGDGFKCTSYLIQLLVFLVPSVFMGVLLLCACVLLIAIGICVCWCKPNSRKINKRSRQSDSKKSPDKKSLNLSMSASL